MRKLKAPAKKLVAVRISPELDRAIEIRCKRDKVMKMHFFELACRKLLEATNA